MAENLFVLGADDHEMRAIEILLQNADLRYAYAVDCDGNRVSSKNAYVAASLLSSEGNGENPGWDKVTHLVECDAPAGNSLPQSVIRIDHHREGDPGYSEGPDKYLSASSLGQIIAETMHIQVPEYEGEYVLSVDTVSVRFVKVRPADGQYRRNFASFPYEFAMIAAADHCKDKALEGECPGIYSDGLELWLNEQGL